MLAEVAHRLLHDVAQIVAETGVYSCPLLLADARFYPRDTAGGVFAIGTSPVVLQSDAGGHAHNEYGTKIQYYIRAPYRFYPFLIAMLFHISCAVLLVCFGNYVIKHIIREEEVAEDA